MRESVNMMQHGPEVPSYVVCYFYLSDLILCGLSANIIRGPFADIEMGGSCSQYTDHNEVWDFYIVNVRKFIKAD